MGLSSIGRSIGGAVSSIGREVGRAVDSASGAVSTAAQQTGSNTQNLVNDLGGEKRLLTYAGTFYAAPLALVNDGYRDEYIKAGGYAAEGLSIWSTGGMQALIGAGITNLFGGGGAGLPEGNYSSGANGQSGSLFSGPRLGAGGPGGVPPIVWIGLAAVAVVAVIVIAKK